MKSKILAFAGILALAAGTAFAADGTQVTFNDSTTSVGTPAASVKVSKNVQIQYQPEAAGLTYSMTSFHTSGTKSYGTSSGDTKIFMKDSTAITDAPAAPAAGASADFSGWTAM